MCEIFCVFFLNIKYRGGTWRWQPGGWQWGRVWVREQKESIWTCGVYVYLREGELDITGPSGAGRLAWHSWVASATAVISQSSGSATEAIASWRGEIEATTRDWVEPEATAWDHTQVQGASRSHPWPHRREASRNCLWLHTHREPEAAICDLTGSERPLLMTTHMCGKLAASVCDLMESNQPLP